VEIQHIIIANGLGWAAAMYFIKMWINGVNARLDKMSEKLDTKVPDSICCERRKVLVETIKDNAAKTTTTFNEVFSRIRSLETHE